LRETGERHFIVQNGQLEVNAMIRQTLNGYGGMGLFGSKGAIRIKCFKRYKYSERIFLDEIFLMKNKSITKF
jgi:hypothetical protein